MRVLIVAPGDEEVGGVQYVIENLARYLQRQGHDIVFLYSGSNTLAKMRTNKQGFTAFDLNLQLLLGERHFIISLILFLIRFPIGMYELIRIIRRKKIQIINVHYPPETAGYFALCRQLLSIGLVTSVHGADLFPGGKPKSKYSRAIRHLLRRSDRIVAPSRAFQKDVATQFPTLKEKIALIHNGVNLAELSAPVEVNTAASRGPYILCIAMHNEKKGLDVLLRAYALIRDAAPGLKLVLVGDGPLRGELEKLAQALGLEGRVEFLGRKGRSQVAQLMQGCEIFVLSSRSEPFGIVLVEAMACKKPVVATMVGGIPEIVENGKNGILVEPDNPGALAEALIRVLQNQDLREYIAENGYSTVHGKFSSDSTGSAYEALFGDVVRSRMKATDASRSTANDG